ncbi:MAG: class I SAM-dependent methyltransferase [Thiohalocapsa sp.]|nr:class I SAM-dependent methyltransferase [Thiohalocapsa sp.]MCF7992122.1 class I SAM-dependent methyltransferase [Thiohalocapsa sp.]
MIRKTIDRIRSSLLHLPMGAAARRRASGASVDSPSAPAAPGAILDCYASSAPSARNALEIFKGEWSSKLPEPLDDQGGKALLFDDKRVKWLLAQCGGVEGESVLELGPLEGGHSSMLERAGASEVIAVEANSRAFLKCLIIKELLRLQRVNFLYGDFVEYLRLPPSRFDLVVACGVLYHMRNPVELIALASAVTDRLFVWTHYYDEAILSAREDLAGKFPSHVKAEYGGFVHTLYRQEYRAALDWAGFCGGGHADSAWMSRDEILGCVRHFGLTEIETAFEAPDHVNGPSFAFFARRPDARAEAGAAGG